MADKNNASDNPEAAGELRNTLVKRLAVAGVLVAVLLGVLAFFDYLSTPEEPEPPTFTKPVPVPPKKEVTQPVKPTESLPEPPKQEAAPEKPAEPPPKPELPPKPEVIPQPAAPAPKPELNTPAKPVVPPVPAQPRVAPAAPQAAKPAMPPAPLAEKPVPPPSVTRPAAPAPLPEAAPAPVSRQAAEPKSGSEAKQLAPRLPEAVAPPHQIPAPLRLFPGYVVQAGVFTSVQRAEELHAKLTLNGIPSTLEARVQAGPFKNREEAAAAREKMKALGIDTVLIPPKGGR